MSFKNDNGEGLRDLMAYCMFIAAFLGWVMGLIVAYQNTGILAGFGVMSTTLITVVSLGVLFDTVSNWEE